MVDSRVVSGVLADRAKRIITSERGQQHGDLEGSFTLIADWWNSYMNHKAAAAKISPNYVPLDAVDVLEMMALVKKARNVYGSPLPDHTVDDIGYTALAGGLRLRSALDAKMAEEVGVEMERRQKIANQLQAEKEGIEIPAFLKRSPEEQEEMRNEAKDVANGN